MAINSKDGKTVIGWIVAGDDNKPDPQGGGRVKILTASDHPETPVDQLPWSQIGAQPSNIGGSSFNRPPQLGTLVEVYFPQGTKGSGHGIVRSVLHNVSNVQGLDGQKGGDVNLITSPGWAKTSRDTAPSKASGPPQHEQKIEKNENGAEKLVTKTTYNPAPSMTDREGTTSTGVSKGMLSTVKGARSIFTGTQWGYYKNEPGTANSGMPTTKLPGEDGNIPDNTEDLKSSIPKELFKTGYGNIGKKLSPGQKTDNKVTNMANQGNKTQKNSWLGAAKGELAKSTNHLELQNAAFKIQTQKFLEEHLKKEKEIKQEIKAPYKDKMIRKKIKPTGEITIENKDEIEKEKKKTVEERMGMLHTAGTKGGVKLKSDELGQKFESDKTTGVHAGTQVAGDMMLSMNSVNKKNAIQKSYENKFVYNSSIHEIGLQFAWFMSNRGLSGGGNTIPDDSRDPQYKSGSSMV